MKPVPTDPTLGDFIRALVSEKKLLVLLVGLGVGASAIIAFLMPRYFVASTLVMPPQQQNQMQGALAQLGSLASFAGASPSKSPEDMYVAFFQTRRIQDVIVKQFDLARHYEETSQEMVREILSSRTVVAADKKTGLISIEVSDRDAALATRMANAYVSEMQKMLASVAVTEAQQRRLFYEDQVQKAGAGLKRVEADFEKAQRSAGFMVPDVMADLGVKEAVHLRASISAKEVELLAAEQTLTRANPGYKRLVAELSALRAQLRGVEGGRSEGASGEGPHAAGSVTLGLYRDMKVRQGVLEHLVKQLEAAKLDVAKDGPLMQQIDSAVQPERASKPKRASIIVLGFLISVTVGVAVALPRGLRNIQAAKTT